MWWQWDAKLTSTLVLWLIFVAYLLLRRYGGPGSERLAAGLALFGMANVPFVYWSVHVWRTVHPQTTVVPTLPRADGRSALAQRVRVSDAVSRSAAGAARQAGAAAGASSTRLYLALEERS